VQQLCTTETPPIGVIHSRPVTACSHFFIELHGTDRRNMQCAHLRGPLLPWEGVFTSSDEFSIVICTLCAMGMDDWKLGQSAENSQVCIERHWNVGFDGILFRTSSDWPSVEHNLGLIHSGWGQGGWPIQPELTLEGAPR
jgi:hypothetical protein